MVGDRPLESARRPADPEAVVVLGADGDLRGGDRGDSAVVELGQDGEVIVERPARDERFQPASDPGRMAAGDETHELIGVGVPMSPPHPEAPALAGSTRHAACFCPSASSLVASHPWGYQASTLRTSPMTLSRINSRGEHDHREAGVGVGDDERDLERGDGRAQAAGLVERGRQRLLAEHRDPRGRGGVGWSEARRWG